MVQWFQDCFIHSQPSKKKGKTHQGKLDHPNHCMPHPSKPVNITFSINYPNDPSTSHPVRTNTSTKQQIHHPPFFSFSEPLQTENKPPKHHRMQHAFIVLSSFSFFLFMLIRACKTISSKHM
ncbi:hypothetical protein COCMIDRAFT_37962 [Bipolaris oryzae ATCC 44560]|uniref:Transmembrane protein n=1 Tax=Bipolaris oryzae ATCC 44560 TaxID=930090 RepID=W6YXL1_COCMI|nr:uncharacterized protein COCMIDRAFT_37962 [Bipolaris oryzae ATCC 44560]EUC44152.1 hypothetical protein COCMIDRAFT_37962 [Bipolaris oryzae ATCC 44560]